VLLQRELRLLFELAHALEQRSRRVRARRELRRGVLPIHPRQPRQGLRELV
jgi:hypothetical protein